MLLKEPDAYVLLESPLLGSLLRSVAVTGSLVDAGAVAARVFEAPGHAPAHCVDVRHPRLSPPQQDLLRDWPLKPGSLFAYADEEGLDDDAFRVAQVAGAIAPSHASLFAPLIQCIGLCDCFILSFPVISPAWCLIAYMRCDGQAPFAQEEILALKRLKPALARIITTEFNREVWACTPTLQAPLLRRPGSEGHPRLSETEKKILPFLRSNATEREIALSTGRSSHTIHVHVKNIYRKLGVNSRRSLQALFVVPPHVGADAPQAPHDIKHPLVASA